MKNSLYHRVQYFFFQFLVVLSTFQAIISVLPAVDTNDDDEDQIVILQAAIEENTDASDLAGLKVIRHKPLQTNV